MNNAFSGCLVEMSDVCSLVSVYHIRIILFYSKRSKWWYLIAMCFSIGKKLLDSAIAIQLWFYSDNLQKTSGFGLCVSKIKDTSCINARKGITSRIAWINVIYSAPVVLKAIYIWNLLQHNTGHPAYVITYPIHDMIFSSLSASTWAHSWESWHLHNTLHFSPYRSCKLCHLWLTVNFCLVNTHMLTCSRGTFQYVWWCVHSQNADYCKNVHNSVWPLIFMVVLIPEDNLTYQPLPCNFIRTYFLNYIGIYAVMVFQRESLLLWYW